MRRIVAAILLLLFASGCQMVPGTTQPEGKSLPGLGTIKGVLKGKDGKPAAHVKVRAFRDASEASAYRIAEETSNGAGTAQAETSDDGSFTIFNSPTGTVSVEADKSDSEKAIAMNVAVLPGAEVKIDALTLAETGAISGRVSTTKAGTDLFGVDVFIPGTSFTAKTDEQGNYTILYIPQGSFRVAASLSGFRRTVLEGIKVESGKVTSVPDISLAYGVTVSGKVELMNPELDPTTINVMLSVTVGENGIVQGVQNKTTKLSADGTYSFQNIVRGNCAVCFECPVTLYSSDFGTYGPYGMTFTRRLIPCNDQGTEIGEPYRIISVSDYGKVLEMPTPKLKLQISDWERLRL